MKAPLCQGSAKVVPKATQQCCAPLPRCIPYGQLSMQLPALSPYLFKDFCLGKIYFFVMVKGYWFPFLVSVEGYYFGLGLRV